MKTPAMPWQRQTRATLFSPGQNTEVRASISPTLKMRTLRLEKLNDSSRVTGLYAAVVLSTSDFHPGMETGVPLC